VSPEPRRTSPAVTTADAPILTVGHLRLVPFTEGDAPDLVAAVRGDEAVARFSLSLRNVRDVSTALAWLAARRRDGHIDWAIRDPEDRLVGRTALHDIDLTQGVGEIGYTVFAAYRRQGIATAVTKALTAYGFEELGLTRLILRHAVANQASCGVAARAGFPLEGDLRSGLRHPAGGHEDAHLHARVRDDPPPSGLPHPTPVELIGDGVRLRPWREEDAGFLLNAMDDADVRAWNPLMLDGRPVASLADARRLAVRLGDWSSGPRGRHCSWVICTDDAPLGHLSLYEVDQVASSSGIGYWVAAAARGQGLATRAVRLAVDWGYSTLGLRRIELFHAVDNPASCAVARAAGFTQEGILRASYRYGDGQLHDEHAHARLAEDPPGPIAMMPAPVEVPADGLRLVPWTEDHAPFLLAAAGDPELVRWNPLRIPSGPVRTLEDAQAWARSHAQWSTHGPSWAVCEPDGTPLGYVALHSLDRDAQLTGQLGYWIAPQGRGRGAASRAVRAAARYGFEVLGLHRLEIFHAVVNPASCRVAEAGGFAFEGMQRMGYRYPEGEFHDEHRHARLAED
jgi:RimJ/RimL family protein N-acetyltransferase